MKKTWLLVVVLVIAASSIAVIVYQSSFLIPRRPSVEGKDLFGIDEIYPTKEGGREWYIDMEDPFSDDLLSSAFDRNITKQQDDSWRIAGHAVRLNVGTPSNTEIWKNVEVTGYAKVLGPIFSTGSGMADDNGVMKMARNEILRMILTGEQEEEDTIMNIHATVQHTQEQLILMVM